MKPEPKPAFILFKKSMKTITSMENPIIKRAIGLKEKKNRDKEEAYLIDGFHVCMEALRSGKDVDQLIVSMDLADKNEEILALSEEAGVKAIMVPEILLNKIADVKTPTGVAAIIKKDIIREEDFFSDKEGNYLVLDRIRDPGNGGTLIRTSEAAGFKGVIVMKGSVDVYSPKVVRAGAGSILRQPLFFVDSPEELLALNKRYGKTMVVTSPKGAVPYYSTDKRNKLCLVIGNEGEGVHETLLNKAELLIEIPMSGQVESLNAAVAGGILMYWFGKENANNG